MGFHSTAAVDCTRGVTDETERTVPGVGVFERGSITGADNCPLIFIRHPPVPLVRGLEELDDQEERWLKF